MIPLKQKLKKAALSIIAGAVLGLIFSLGAFAQEENLKIFFSGLLRNSQGETAETGSYNMRFSLYQSPTTTDVLWQEEFLGENKVNIISGKFQVILGSQNPFSLDIKNDKYWLGASVGGSEEIPIWDEEMKPRIPVVTLESLFLDGSLEVSHEEFIKALLEEFKQSATSSQALDQRAFLRFLQEKLMGAEGQAVIISPQALNLLFEEILNFESDVTNVLPEGFWASLLQFFRDILNTISQSLTQVFEQLNEIVARLVNIETKQDEIISILTDGASEEDTLGLEQIENDIQRTPMVSRFGTEFIVEDFGEALILQGETTVKVFSPYLTNNSKIFVTPKSPIEGMWWISDKLLGEYFEVSILTPPSQDLRLDYWIITPKEEMLTVLPLPELEDVDGKKDEDNENNSGEKTSSQSESGKTNQKNDKEADLPEQEPKNESQPDNLKDDSKESEPEEDVLEPNQEDEIDQEPINETEPELPLPIEEENQSSSPETTE